MNPNNLIVKRPGIGISPLYWDKVINMIAKKDINENVMIKWDQLIEKSNNAT